MEVQTEKGRTAYRMTFISTTVFNFTFILFLAMCSLISINTQGLRSDDRRQLAFNFLSRNRFEIIMLQETHWTEDMHRKIQQEWKGKILFNDGSASAHGVAILFHEKLDLDIKHSSRDNSGRTLTTTFTMENTDLNLINIYAPNTDTERHLFYSDLEKFLAPENNILAGDFNSIQFQNLEQLGRADFHLKN